MSVRFLVFLILGNTFDGNDKIMKDQSTKLQSCLWNKVMVALNKDNETVDIRLLFNPKWDLSNRKNADIFVSIITANGYIPTLYYSFVLGDKIQYSISYISEYGNEGVATTNSSKIDNLKEIQRLLESERPKRLIVEKSDGTIVGQPLMVEVKEGGIQIGL